MEPEQCMHAHPQQMGCALLKLRFTVEGYIIFYMQSDHARKMATYWRVVGIMLLVLAIPLSILVGLSPVPSRRSIYSFDYLSVIRSSAQTVSMLIIGIGGLYCLRRAKRLRLVVAGAGRVASAAEGSSRVLYLRPFSEDKRSAKLVGQLWGQTVEEEIAEALLVLGELIALGDPNDPIPHLGAKRRYVDSAEWQAQVLSEAQSSDWIVMHAIASPGVRWEIENIVSRCDPQRLVLIVPDATRYKTFVEDTVQFFPHALPPTAPLGERRARKFVTGIIHFDIAWRPQVAECRPSFLHRKPILSGVRAALHTLLLCNKLSAKPETSWNKAQTALLFGFVVCFFAACVIFVGPSLYRDARIFFFPTDRVLAEIRKEWVNDPLFVRHFAGLKPADAEISMRNLVVRGLPGLSAERLSARYTVIRKLLDTADATDCVLIAQGDRDATVRNFRILSESDLRAYFSGAKEAAQVALSGSPIDAPTNTQFDAAVEVMRAQVGSDRVLEVVQLFQNPSGVTPADLCAAYKLWISSILALDEPHRSVLIRADLSSTPPVQGR